MKRLIVVSVIAIFATLLFVGANHKTQNQGSKSVYTTTFTKGKVDTVVWVRERGVTGAGFSLTYGDSIITKSAFIYRKIAGATLAPAATDTLTNCKNIRDSSATASGVKYDSFTLTPYADEYWFVITYDTTTVKIGVTSPTVTYTIEKN